MMADKITMQNNQLIISSFKPKVVEMHGREHLERFREAAEATGVGLNWTQWRFTVEVGGKLYLELVKKGEIPQSKIITIMEQMGLPVVDGAVKQELTPQQRQQQELAKLYESAKKFGMKLVVPSVDFEEPETKGASTTSVASTSSVASTATSTSTVASSVSTSSF